MGFADHSLTVILEPGVDTFVVGAPQEPDFTEKFPTSWSAQSSIKCFKVSCGDTISLTLNFLSNSRFLIENEQLQPI